MKLKLFSVLALGGLLSAAFACGDSSGDGGSGGSGGEGGDTTTTTGTKGSGSTTKATTGASPTTTTGMNTTSSGQMGCDALPCSDNDMDPANDCQGCAISGACNAEATACANEPECIDDFFTCIEPCADQACFDACVQMYPTGADLYAALAACVICQECYNSCDGASAGCP